MDELTTLSKAISRVLRHRPDAAGVMLDKEGWCRVDELLAGLARAGTVVSVEQLREVVRTSDKRRFALSDDGQLIRANQGHSVQGVTLRLPARTPPSRLFHGTAAASLSSIAKQGLLPMRRHHVHLSPDVATATAVGARRGKPVILEIDAASMHRAGHKFMLSDNGVWLVDAVPPQYIRAMPTR
ncbi:RNA 2'-phosphotransferase [Rhizobacter sp. SG703]|uniref:RNA 2'-phosphotransferase n=1 Tax=Rhizobacter sp. SG703 TaxID=2587140 RepID=UPI0014484A95|nr:RNA 2'-phosphotransferase [Rhizobacter sp. SG703]NKI93903.1 putative RNA 2'-phosphotransferase [Rhizobacter sp. SG703]